MDFEKLPKIKQGIVRDAYQWGYVGSTTYPREKEWLRRKGWIQSRRIGDNVIGSQWMLTPAGRKAYEMRSIK